MQLTGLLREFTNITLPTQLSKKKVNALVNDSRHIVSGCVFLAIRGIASHALEHLNDAQCEKVSAIIYEPDYDISCFEAHADKFIALPDLHKYVGDIARIFYAPQFPSPIIGITGTNGKTSISQFITQLADYACIGTMGYGTPDHLIELSHTTPDALLTQRTLAKLSERYLGVAMEVSSHAMSLNRVDAVDFEVAVFTNLSQDHLDYHADMEDYFKEKVKLFKIPSVKTVIINTDDNYGMRLAEAMKADGKRVIAYGQQARCTSFDEHVHIGKICLSQQGISSNLTLNLNSESRPQTLLSPVWGTFNVYNILGAVLALYATGANIDALLRQSQLLQGIKGRIEKIDLKDAKTAIIDYAHTPDALKNTLLSLREHMREHAKSNNTHEGQIYTVFGCGGDRDSNKRPLMAEAVNAYSDFGIITDDNPRTENRENIFDGILTGNIDTERFKVIPERRDAINFGLERLLPHDTLLIAGKGHEDYQIIGVEKNHFSDHEVVQKWLKKTTLETVAGTCE